MFAEMPLDNRTVDRFRGLATKSWLSSLETSPSTETT